MSDLASIFNPAGAQAAPAKTNTELYKVSYKDGKNNIYGALIRFLPWVNDPSKCIIEKQVSWVKNPLTQEGKYIDDPRSIGEFSPVSDMFFKFYNTKNDTFIDYAKKNLSAKTQYASLVQIIQDEQHPDLNGQIKVFVYGKTIWQFLYNEEHPVIGTGSNPFHPITGRFFYIYCTEKSGFNNFDQCKFIDNTGNINGMYIPKLDGSGMEQATAETDPNRIIEYLKVNSPDLSKYEFQPWTQDQAKFVEDVIQISATYLQTGNLPSNLGTLNGVNMQPRQQATFPGANMQPQMGMPQMGMPQMGMPQMGMPQQPQMGMPQPQPQPQSQPQPQPMSGFNIGGMPGIGVQPNPQPQQGATNPGISGINLPPTMSEGKESAPTTGSIGGNIEDILKNI
jgi:hypothetical protein